MKHDDLVELITDLKQFIGATVSQQLSLQSQELREEIKRDTQKSIDESVNRLRQEMNQRFAEQDEKLDEIMNAVGGDLQDHDLRITDNSLKIRQLEKKIA